MIVITANDWRIYGNSVIILGMGLKTTDVTVFLSKCFYLCFHAQEEYNVDIKKFITSSDDGLSFKFYEFIDNLKKSKKTYGLIPIDVFYENFCKKDVLQRINESFEEASLIEIDPLKFFVDNSICNKFSKIDKYKELLFS